jgi:glyoxylase-like metal-dependent hydrolase (beta-lactamase superfamily II)
MSASPPRGTDAGAESAEAHSAGPQPQLEELPGHRIALLRAPNPGPLTLSGTNSWLVGGEPVWVVDPGPLLDAHLERLLAAIDARGGLGGVVLTHDHHDHSEAVQTLVAERPAPLAGGRGDVDVTLVDGLRFGPFHALATPGHALDHFALVAEGGCFTGDAVLGEGSVFISPYPGAMSAYVPALERLRAREDFDVLCPGHGPPVWDPQSKLDEYIGHRIDRENSLIAALADGNRTIAALLDAAWPEVPEALRPLATATLAAHLDKLAEEGALPPGVERPTFEGVVW